MLYDSDFEVDCIRERLIAEKEAKIQELEEELRELKNPKSLKQLVDRQILGVRYWDSDNPEEFYHIHSWTGHEQWDLIRRLCLFLWKPRHRKDRCLIRNMEKEELQISARMAEEMIDIWNKYLVCVYKKEED